MGKQPAAVIGVGQTHYRAERKDVSMAGLCREAIDRALADANMSLDDIDAVVVGKAPDLFEGVMMPELLLAEALGAVGKPLLRVHTAGSVGGSTAIVASSLVQAGVHKRVLAVAFEKQSESNAMWALSVPVPFIMPVHAGAGGYFAPHVRSYIRRSGAPTHIGAMVAAKDRHNALKNPYAHLQQTDMTMEKVLESQMLWDPIRYDETCPSSDGACAVVIVDEDTAASSPQPGLDPRHRDAHRADDRRRARPGQPAGRARRGRRAVEAGRHHLPARRDRLRGDLRAVLVVRADVAGEPRLRRPGRRLEAHRGGRDRDRRQAPGQLSGGVLSSNPIGASGMIRFAEAALQVRGAAGEHQVDGARRALGHAYGGGSQFFAMWVVGADKPSN